MWQCTKCRESIEDSFDVCWSCGTSKDGVEDPSFQKADDAEGAPSDAAGEFRHLTIPRAVPPEDAIQAGEPASIAPAVDSKCPHCAGVELIRGVRLGLTAGAGSVGLKYRTLLVLVRTEPLYADVCKGCGSVARFYVRETDRNWLME
jgi:hypothetical protein